MSSTILNSAWKHKIQIINIFDEKFLNEKDIALQPINLILDKDNSPDNSPKKQLTNKGFSINNNNNIQKKNSNKEIKKQKKREAKKSIKSYKSSGLYNSNIVIVQSLTADSERSSLNQIEKEVEKLKKIINKSKSKKNKNKSKSKMKTHNSNKY